MSYHTSLLDTRPCHYCEIEVKAIRLTDGVCENLECQAILHRSYGDAEFSEFCSRHDMDPAEWDEFFAARDRVQINDRICNESNRARFALKNLIQLLKENEHEIARDRYALRGLRYTRRQLETALEDVERAATYEIKE